MAELNNKTLAIDFVSFLEKYYKIAKKVERSGQDNEKTVGSAWVYEKIRVSLEYQEEHLVFKNAMARILHRQYTLAMNPTALSLKTDLFNELAWADYLNPEALTDEENKKITTIIEKYLVILKYAQSGRYRKHDLSKMIVGWLVCELDEALRPSGVEDLMVDYAYNVLKGDISTKSVNISENDLETQLKITLYTLLFKPDLPLVQYWLLKRVYPDWKNQDLEETKKFAQSFDPYFNKIEREIHHPIRQRISVFAKRSIAPFILLNSILISGKLQLDRIMVNPLLLERAMIEEYNTKIEEGRKKVWRGTFRALIFILLTKISLAIVLEIPFDKLLIHRVDYLSLIINVSLPPFLMLVAGTFIKSPSKNNFKLITNSVKSLIFTNKIEEKVFPLADNKPSVFDFLFNTFYTVLTLAILAGAIWLLILLDFNIVSILLFFFFISIVSFFSFRIRNIALELAMKRSRDDALTSFVELLFLPFIRIGKSISERFAQFNPLILALDFLIEAPLKSIIKLLNSWFKFINTKKEELEF